MSTARKLAATAVADLDQGVVLARVDIAVPPERVFKALTTDELTQWWGAPEMYRTTKHTIDLRKGGAWKSEGVGADGHTFHVGGEVLDVDPPHKLTYTWKPSWEPGEATTVSYRLEAIATGTRVTVRHSGFTNPAACGDHANGWERVFGWLGKHFAAEPDKFFLLRLLAPRASFMQDMTAEEAELMKAHGAYLQGKLAEGIVMFYGPVADPKGGWGLGIVRGKDEAAIQALVAGDPTVASGKGFRYEVLPIVRAFY